RRRHTRFSRDWSSDVCSSDLAQPVSALNAAPTPRPKNVFLGLGVGAAFKALTGWARVVPDSLEAHIPFLRKGQLGSDVSAALFRSEERRVGREERSIW